MCSSVCRVGRDVLEGRGKLELGGAVYIGRLTPARARAPQVVDETMQRCNATTCAVVDRWNKALLNKTINTYTPKTDIKDKKQEYCWVEYCRKGACRGVV